MRRWRYLPLLACLLAASVACGAVPPLALDVRTGIERYSTFMSSVPGLPIKVSSADGASVRIGCDAGSLSLWGPDTDSRVMDQGTTYEGKTPVTVYWSPFSGEDATEAPLPDAAGITVTVAMEGRPSRTMRVAVTTDEDGFYVASVHP